MLSVGLKDGWEQMEQSHDITPQTQPRSFPVLGLGSFRPSHLVLLLSSGHSGHPAQTTLRPSCDPETGKAAIWEKRPPAALLISSALGEGAVGAQGAGQGTSGAVTHTPGTLALRLTDKKCT